MSPGRPLNRLEHSIMTMPWYPSVASPCRRIRGGKVDGSVKADEQLAGGEQDYGDGPGRHDALMRCRVERGAARIERCLRHDMTSKSERFRPRRHPSFQASFMPLVGHRLL